MESTAAPADAVPPSSGDPLAPSTTVEDGESRTRSSTRSSGRLRSASIRFLESNPPSGMWHATGQVLAQAPTPSEIRRGDFGRQGWDGPIQRRNSVQTVNSLSRVSSAQTPMSLVKTKTNPLEAHHEAEEEQTAKAEASGGATAQPTKPPLQQVPRDADDDDDPFSKFIGRGRIESQSFEPKSKTAKAAADAEDEVSPSDDGDETDSLDDLDPRPKKRKSALPKKFLDPTGDDVPRPNEKSTPAVAAAPASSPSPPLKSQDGPDEDGVYPNGYKFPPEHTRWEATVIGAKAFWKFTWTPLGFCIVIYGLNIVAWGGMLFLLLIGGGNKYMCHPHNKPPGYHDCNDLYAPRRIWIEIDSQILNALFCVTGLGLIPWRFRDLFYLLQYRLRHKVSGLRRLGGIHRVWFRLPGSHNLPPDPPAYSALPDPEQNTAIALPVKKAPDPPLTGFRAPETSMWKLDFVIWAFVLNTFLQIVLCGFMWGLNRFNRPSWSTGLFIALACIVAGMGGLMSFVEGKRIKKVEGIPVTEEEMLHDVEKQVDDAEKSKKSKLPWQKHKKQVAS